MTTPLPPTFDSDDFTKLTQELGIIPYYSFDGKTGHAMLRTLYSLYNYSVTQGAVVNKIINSSFGGDIEIMKRTIKGVRTPQQTTEVPYNEIEKVVNDMTELGVEPTQITEVSKELGRNLKVCGNAYLLLRKSTVLGAVKYSIESVHPLHCYIQINGANTDRWFLITKELNLEYMTKFPPKKVRMFPNFSTDRGVQETIIHIKTKTDASDYYGRPECINSILQQITEYNAAVKAQRITSKGFTAAYILAEEAQELSGSEDDKQTAATNKAERIRNKATIASNEGGDTLLYMQYAQGLNAPQLIKFDLHLDVGYDLFTLESCESAICKSHGYPLSLLGGAQKSSSIGTNATLMYDMVIADSDVIKPLQERLQSIWSLVFSIMATEKPTLNEYQPAFTSKAADLVQTISLLNTKPNTNVTTQNTNPT